VNKLKIAIADDHRLFRDGLTALLETYNYNVVYHAQNGKEIFDYAMSNPIDVILMDLHMPVMNGWDATARIVARKPGIKTLALSMLDDEISVVKMFKAGARGYLLKDVEPEELHAAITDVMTSGFYFSDFDLTKTYDSGQSLNLDQSIEHLNNITDRELEFLKLNCSDLPYKAIAEQMEVSTRTIDGYRDALFRKLKVHTRVGLVLFAIKHKIVILT
jgi:DNA-binding NarL/FixJ family response regulator